MAITFSRYDTVDYLATEADIAAYLAAAEEDGDPSVMAAARQDAERARARWRSLTSHLPKDDASADKSER
ncbi:hypothetical protein ACMHYJ_06970 [Castellaniella hirudinis]|uniref:hypothetical protein n=1 Tax=Castellaniella hirudinis TaxID=1144617 RepID=UPI0039C28BA5